MSSVTVPYEVQDEYYDSPIPVPLGVEVQGFRVPDVSERVIYSYEAGQPVKVDLASKWGDVRSKSVVVKDNREFIFGMYGVKAHEIPECEGFRHKNELRSLKKGDWYLNTSLKPEFAHKGYSSKRLILEKIEAPKPETPKVTVHTSPAADVIRTFGVDVIDAFYMDGFCEHIYDLYGYEFTGALRNVKPGEWYLNTNNQPQLSLYGSGVYLILRKLEDEKEVVAPRIVQYLKTSVKDWEFGEQAFLRDEKGGMRPYNEFDDDPLEGQFVYVLSEEY